jgi:hypothetical protein
MNNLKLSHLLDQHPVREIEAYLKEIEAYLNSRRRKEYLSKGAVDGWERTPVDVLNSDWEDTDIGGFYIEKGSWLWRDAQGRIRRAFGCFGDEQPAAMTFDEDGRPIQKWELLDDADIMSRIGTLDMDDDGHLAVVRWSLMAAPITRDDAPGAQSTVPLD